MRWVETRPRSLVYLDPSVRRLYDGNVAVYRYCSLTEALSLFERGSWQFKRPSAWRDPYEKHVGKRLFGSDGPFADIGAFAKCFSLESQSEAMWRLYSAADGLVRLSFGLKHLIDSLQLASHQDRPRPKLFIGRARYMPQAKLRAAVALLEQARPESVSRFAMEALLMKRDGFIFENEIRACFLYREPSAADATTEQNLESHRTVESVSSKIIQRVLLDPYVSPAVARAWTRMLREGCKVECDVTQSKFNLDPISD